MQRIAIDWFRLLWDLVQRGMTLRDIANRCDIAPSTLKGYLRDSHPPHWRGELLVALWCEVCGKGRIDVPVTAVVLTPRVVRRVEMSVADEACRELERAWR